MGKCEGKWKVSHQGLYLVMYLYVRVTELHHLVQYYSETATMQICTPIQIKKAFNENIQRAMIKQSVCKTLTFLFRLWNIPHWKHLLKYHITRP